MKDTGEQKPSVGERVERLREPIDELRSFAVSVIGGLALLGIVVLLAVHVLSDERFISPVVVAGDLADLGYEHPVATRWLGDELQQVFAVASSETVRGDLALEVIARQSVNFEVPGTGISFGGLVRLLRDFFGISRDIRAEMLKEGTHLVVRLRAHNTPAFECAVPVAAEEDLGARVREALRCAAARYARTDQPIVAAAYYYVSALGHPDTRARYAEAERALADEVTRACGEGSIPALLSGTHPVSSRCRGSAAVAFNLWGLVARAQEDPGRAERLFAVSLELNPGSEHAETNLLRVRRDRNGETDQEQILRGYERILGSHADSAYGYVPYAQYLSELGRNSEAIDLLRAASDAAPREPAVWVNRGLTAQKMNNLGEAELAYEAAALLRFEDPSLHMAEAGFHLTVAYKFLEDRDERQAARHLAKARSSFDRAAPHDGATVGRADVLRLSASMSQVGFGGLTPPERLAAAIDEYHKVLAADPTHGSANSGLANSYLMLGRFAEAIDHLALAAKWMRRDELAALCSALAGAPMLEQVRNLGRTADVASACGQ